MPTINMDPNRKGRPSIDTGRTPPEDTRVEHVDTPQIQPAVIGSTNIGTIGFGGRMPIGGRRSGVGNDASYIVSDYGLNTDQRPNSNGTIFDTPNSENALRNMNDEELTALGHFTDAFNSYTADSQDTLKSAGGRQGSPLSSNLNQDRPKSDSFGLQQPAFLVPKAPVRPNSASPAGSNAGSYDSPHTARRDMNTSKSSLASHGEQPMFPLSEDECDQISPFDPNTVRDRFTFDVTDSGRQDLSKRKRHESDQQGTFHIATDEEEKRSLSYQDIRPKDDDFGQDNIDGLSAEFFVKGALQAGRKTSFGKLFPWGKDKEGKCSAEDVSVLGGSLPRSQTDSGFFKSVSNKLTRSFGKGKKTKTVPAHLSSLGKPLFTDTLVRYPERKKETAICLVISMCTGDLKGYKKDHTDLVKFYDSLGYSCIQHTNLTQAQLFQAIKETKDKIRGMKKKITHLVVAILTHGEEEGIHTTSEQQPLGMFEERNADGSYVVTKLETILNEFKHDGIEELKGVPKFFIIQACHGREIVKAAGGRRSKNVEQADCGEDEDQVDFTYQTHLPVDADFLVLSAATKYNRSFVSDQNGSWLIQLMLEVFRNMHKKEDVEVMLKAVTLAVSERRKGMTYEDGSQEVAAQVPSRQSTLRKVLYL